MSDAPDVAFALEGLRVLDFGQGIAGPYCAQLLGDQGADVIKVEPPRGDWSRTMGAQTASRMSGSFVSVNRNKRGICLDLGREEGRAAARDLARRADVLVDSFRPGVMDRLGLGHAELCAAQPRLVYVSVTGFGDSGPNVDLPASDSTMQAYGGLMSVVGECDGQPLRIGNVVSDMVTGANAYSGALLALLARAASGRGRRVEVALLDSIVAFQAPPLTEYLLTGHLPRRCGNQHPLIAPSGMALTRDGMLMFTVFDHHWRRFCSEMDLPGLSEDPRFVNSGARQSHRDQLSDALAPVFAREDTDYWLRRLRGMDVQCAAVNDYASLLRDPQVLHNGLLQTMSGDDGAELPGLRNPVRLNGYGSPRRAPPRLGEHTVEVLRRELGMAPDGVAALLADRAAFAATPADSHNNRHTETT